jgi:hypothetical protein
MPVRPSAFGRPVDLLAGRRRDRSPNGGTLLPAPLGPVQLVVLSSLLVSLVALPSLLVSLVVLSSLLTSLVPLPSLLVSLVPLPSLLTPLAAISAPTSTLLAGLLVPLASALASLPPPLAPLVPLFATAVARALLVLPCPGLGAAVPRSLVRGLRVLADRTADGTAHRGRQEREHQTAEEADDCEQEESAQLHVADDDVEHPTQRDGDDRRRDAASEPDDEPVLRTFAATSALEIAGDGAAEQPAAEGEDESEEDAEPGNRRPEPDEEGNGRPDAEMFRPFVHA